MPLMIHTFIPATQLRILIAWKFCSATSWAVKSLLLLFYRTFRLSRDDHSLEPQEDLH
jgi:hypothetical protein